MDLLTLGVQRRAALAWRGSGANVTRGDFITTVLDPATKQVREVLVIDINATVAGKSPMSKTIIPGSWRTEVNAAVSPGRLDLDDAVLENGIRAAVQEGRVRLRQLNVNYSPSPQGQEHHFNQSASA